MIEFKYNGEKYHLAFIHHPASRGSFFEPPEDEQFEITELRDSTGADVTDDALGEEIDQAFHEYMVDMRREYAGGGHHYA